MPGLGSLVERTMHFQIQHFTTVRTPTPVLAALIVFVGLPIVGCASSSSVSALTTSLGNALVKPHTTGRIPLLSTLFDTFLRAFNTTCLRVRIHVKTPIQWWHTVTFTRGQGRTRTENDDTYATPRAEAKYWRVAARYRRRLYSGDSTRAMSVLSSSVPSGASHRDESLRTRVSLVTYYTPRLLPLYRAVGGHRKPREADVDAREGWVSPRTFCKWHRMVFPGSSHPTLAQAALQMKYYSNRDLREIQRMARLIPDDHVFLSKGKATRKGKATMKYSEMWKNWLEQKGVDIGIVFE